MGATYKEAGVNIDAGTEAVRRMKANVRATFNANVLGDLGSFGGLFKFPKNRWKNPVLVSSADGVGTKIMVAAAAKVYDTIGQDLVNHCINDILVQGAEPLFFLDYFATGKLDPKVVALVVKGLAKSCRQQGTVLIGGETAEMPGLYAPGDFDLAGTIVGAVDKSRVITGKTIRPGDMLIGLPSNGLHTNGYSLARHVLLKKKKYPLKRKMAALGESVADALLKPHTCYAKPVLALRKKVAIHGIAHITGGGLPENTPRVLPEGCQAVFNRGAWPVPPIFDLIVRDGKVPEEDAYRTLNMGLGLVLAVRSADAEKTLSLLRKGRQKAYLVGKVVRGRRGVKLA